MPDIDDYKITSCNHLANFAIDKNYRGKQLGKLLINEIIKNYALYYHNSNIKHSQPLICGKGLLQIADPSWRKYMLDIGFKHRIGAETFFIDQDWDPLQSIIINGKKISNKEFNYMYNVPQIYESLKIEKNDNIHLYDRVPKILELAKSDKAKIQYFQLYYLFEDFAKLFNHFKNIIHYDNE